MSEFHMIDVPGYQGLDRRADERRREMTDPEEREWRLINLLLSGYDRRQHGRRISDRLVLQ